jgi:hypothetical protein
MDSTYGQYLATLNSADIWVELQHVTGMSPQDFADFEQLPPANQRNTLTTYSHLEWTHPGTTGWEKFMAILGIIGTVAGVVSGVAGAVSGVQAVAALLKAA